MLKENEIIILDLDGPLLDGKQKHYNCYRRILESNGFSVVDIEIYWQMKRSRCGRGEILRKSDAESLHDQYLSAWLDLIETPEFLALDRIQEGALECLKEWRRRGSEIVLVTMRKDRGALESQLALLGLKHYFADVLVCDYRDGGRGKARAVQKSVFSGPMYKDAVWIGDTEVDWEAGKLLGYRIVLLANGLRNEMFLGSLEGAQVLPSILSLKGLP